MGWRGDKDIAFPASVDVTIYQWNGSALVAQLASVRPCGWQASQECISFSPHHTMPTCVVLFSLTPFLNLSLVALLFFSKESFTAVGLSLTAGTFSSFEMSFSTMGFSSGTFAIEVEAVGDGFSQANVDALSLVCVAGTLA